MEVETLSNEITSISHSQLDKKQDYLSLDIIYPKYTEKQEVMQNLSEDKGNEQSIEQSNLTLFQSSQDTPQHEFEMSSHISKTDKVPLLLVEVKRKKIRIKKEKMKFKQFKTEMIFNHSLLTEKNSSQIPSYIFRLIPEKKIYFLAGDILVEIEDQVEGEIVSSMIFNEFRNITSIESSKNFISFSVETICPLKQLRKVIFQLENSQSQENYIFAQLMKIHQNTIFLIQDMIQQVINSYKQNPDELYDLLKEREKYMNEERKKLIEQSQQNDQFASIGSLTLSFENQCTTISKMTITRPSLAIIGGDDQQLVDHFLRRGFINLFNYASRKILFSLNMEAQNKDVSFISLKKPIEFQFKVPYFEICTLDEIKVACECTISSIHVKYPEHLHFIGENVSLLNNIENFFFVKYHITNSHIETIINLRQGKDQQLQKSIRENIIMGNLEYFVKSQMFLEKYYKDEYDKFEEEIKLQKSQEAGNLAKLTILRCGYKKIDLN